MKKLKITVGLMLVAAAAAFAAENCNEKPDCVQQGPCPGCTYLGVAGGANIFCQSGSESGCISVGPSQAYVGTDGYYVCDNGTCGNVLHITGLLSFHETPKGTDPNCPND